MLLLPLPLPGLELQACTTIPRLIKGLKQCQIYKKCSRLEVQLNPREACKHMQGYVFNPQHYTCQPNQQQGREGKRGGGRENTNQSNSERKVGGEGKRRKERAERERKQTRIYQGREMKKAQ